MAEESQVTKEPPQVTAKKPKKVEAGKREMKKREKEKK